MGEALLVASRAPERRRQSPCRLTGSPNERLALLFRDWLRTHPAAVPPYAAFKLALAQAVTDVGTYTEIMDPVVAPRKGIVEVDLTADLFDDAWHQLHTLPTRAFIDLAPIDAAECEDLTGALVAASEREDLDGAMVRVQLRNVTLAAQAAMDRRAIDEAFSRCLHLDIDAKTIGERGEVSAPQDLRAFLAGRVPSGMDASAFIARVEGYLGRASDEIGA